MKIKAKIPVLQKPHMPANAFYNNIITYFIVHGLNFTVIERKKLPEMEVVQFRLNKINQKLGINTHYSTMSETIREMVINYIFLPESEKEKIKVGDFIEKFKN